MYPCMVRFRNRSEEEWAVYLNYVFRFVTFKISLYYRLNKSVCAMSSLAFQGEVRSRSLPLVPLIEQKRV